MEVCCAPDMWEGADKFFIALGDENRQKILMLLGKGKRICVNDITNESHLSRPAISHHLKAFFKTSLTPRVSIAKYIPLSLKVTKPMTEANAKVISPAKSTITGNGKIG